MRLRCMVLGGKGFIGSHLTEALLAAGHFVRVFDRPVTPFLEGRLVESSAIHVCPGDFSSEADVKRVLENIDICFHLISSTIPEHSNADPVYDIQANLVSTVQMLRLAVDAHVTKIIFLSSGGTVYGIPTRLPIDESHATDPICSYGITKLTIEKYLFLYERLHGLDYVVLRIANAFGERQRPDALQGAVGVFLGKALRGDTIHIWGDGSTVRDYVHVSDIVSSILASMHYHGAKRIFNIGSGKGRTLNEVIDAIQCVTGCNPKRVYESARAVDVPANVLSIELAQRELGWRPQTSFLEGIRRTAGWLQSFRVHPQSGGPDEDFPSS